MKINTFPVIVVFINVFDFILFINVFTAIADNEYITSIVVSYTVGAAIVFISFFMSLNIGVLRYEIKRLGYSE